MYPVRIPLPEVQEIKTVHFIRHAQGLHNVAGMIDVANYQLEEFADSLLSEVGHEQCAKAREDMVRRSALLLDVDLVVVSPLRRTLQTASLVFADRIGSVEFFALEDIREQAGKHPCDRRRNISEQQVDFPHVDFSGIEEDVDPLYCIYDSVREPSEDVRKRVDSFWRWVSTRKERNIAVVTHSAYLGHFKWPAGEDPHFENCEIRSYVYQFPN
jgi:broad specificity phosphatase PhoE